MSTKYIASNWRLPNKAGVDSYLNDNYGLTFDGSEFINCGDDSLLNFERTDAFSISAWVKRVGSGSYQSIVYKAKNSSPFNGYAFYIDNNDKVGFNITVDYFANNYFGKVCTSVLNTDWNNVLITYNGNSNVSGLNIYINGDLQNVTTVGTSSDLTGTLSNTIPVNIGARNNTDVFFNGSISEVAIFDYALSEPQISTLYGSSSLGAGNPMALKPAPVAFYPLGDNSASNPLTQPNEAVEDASVFDFDGTNYIETSAIDLGLENTISFWAKSDGVYFNGMVWGGTLSGNYVVFLTNTNNIAYRVGDAANFFNNSNIVSALGSGNWFHCALVRNNGGADVLCYINGDLKQTITGINGSSNNTILQNIGARNIADFKINGELSNIQIWDKELIDSEVETLYNNGQPLMTGTQPQEANLKAWYKLNQTANWEADTAGNWQIPDAVSSYPQSFDFGSNDNIEVDNIGNLFSGITNFSFSGWFNLTSFSHIQIFNIKLQGSDWFNDWRFSINMYANQLRFNIHPGVAYIANLQNITSVNQWFHYAGVFNGSGASDTDRLKLYINGQPQTVTYNTTTPNSFPTLPSTVDTYIGGTFYPFNGMTGKASNIQLWTSSLIPSQIETLYNNGVPLTTTIASDNLKAWYKLNNTATFSTNWSIPDASGNGNTGTSSGMTEQNLVNNNVSALNGESSGMTSANLVLSDLSKSIPYDSYSFNFDAASSDYIDCGTGLGNTLTTVTNFTVNLWIKADVTNGNDLFFNIGSFSNAWGKIVLQLNGDYLYIRINDNDYFIQKSYTSNDWNNISFVYDGSDVNKTLLYINGQEQTPDSSNGTFPSSINLTGFKTIIGAGYGTAYSFDGKISNISIFNETLTSTEVMKLYSNGVPQDLANFTPSPVAWYPLGSNSFWNGSQWTVRDMIGSNDGTGQNIVVDGLVGDAPRSEANGIGTNMDIESNITGSTKWSDNNSWSINMSSTARVEDTP